jgi:phage gpG-like protein
MAIADLPIQAEQFGDYLRSAGDRLTSGSFAPALVDMKHIAEEGIAENFLESKSAAGIPWAPRKRDYPWPILIKTGHLMRSAVTESEAGHVEGVGPRDAFTGTNVFYAGFHQFGTSKMPARPFQEVGDRHVDRMEDALAAFVIETVFA